MHVRDLLNINAQLAADLEAVGITTRQQLQDLGSLAAHAKLLAHNRRRYFSKGLDHLEGALRNCHRSAIPDGELDAMDAGTFSPEPRVYDWPDEDVSK